MELPEAEVFVLVVVLAASVVVIMVVSVPVVGNVVCLEW